MSLPAVLLLKNRKACVLLSPPRDGKVEIATPTIWTAATRYPLAELEAVYTGQCWWCGRRSGSTTAVGRS